MLQDPRQRRLFSPGDLKDFFTLKADQSAVKEGGDGITETGDLMRGVGVVQKEKAKKRKNGGAAPEEVQAGGPTDAQKTLTAVMGSKVSECARRSKNRSKERKMI